MSELSRRNFFKLGACVVGGACAANALPQIGQSADEAEACSTLTTTLPYPRTRLANLTELPVGKPLALTYPDQSSPISLLKLGRRAVNGAGPDQDIVAFSHYCTHMGGTLTYRSETGAYHCPLHYAMFDAAKGGLIVIGQATDNLPQLDLDVDAHGNIYAVGVKGLIYGRQANVLASPDAR
ncbi:MAG: arsenate reductase (azurin) small subunit [Nitrospira sp.]|nr:arsenate reductase (azurin) small subunit [Nitrospira sp.]